MTLHRRWDSPAWDAPPLAPAVGPFAGRGFLQVMWEHRRRPGDELVFAESAEGLVALVRNDGDVRFVGEADLTDYHSPLGPDPRPALAEAVATIDGRWELDSIPVEGVDPVVEGLEGGGANVEVVEDTVTAVVSLPATFDEYLASIGKKQRHELRRKRRRYVEVVGSLVHEAHHDVGWAFDEFVRLHRLAAGDKGTFMTADMEALFRALVALEGWRVDLLRIPGTDRAAAAMFGYADDDGYFLYNSAYDPELAAASPGWVLLGTMIERAIAEGRPRFDFLKGDEEYKFRFGAEERRLCTVRAMR